MPGCACGQMSDSGGQAHCDKLVHCRLALQRDTAPVFTGPQHRNPVEMNSGDMLLVQILTGHGGHHPEPKQCIPGICSNVNLPLRGHTYNWRT